MGGNYVGCKNITILPAESSTESSYSTEAPDNTTATPPSSSSQDMRTEVCFCNTHRCDGSVAVDKSGAKPRAEFVSVFALIILLILGLISNNICHL